MLRPDYTPAIARSAVKYYGGEDMPVKLCYVGNTFVNSSDYQGRLKETTQCGAELIGDDSIAADAEILAMVVEALTDAGLDEFQISVGHADIFSGLAEASALDEDRISQLHELIMNKNFFGVEEFVSGLSISPELAKLFSLLGSFNIRKDEFKAAKEYAADYPKILGALMHLEELGSYMADYGIDRYITFEPGLISDYRYYTGIIFAGFTFGSGEPVVRGGRYDKLLSYFGRDIPSIGFTIGIDQLLAVLTRQNIHMDTDEKGILLVYHKDHAAEAFACARKLRKEEDEIVNMIAYDESEEIDYESLAERKHLAGVRYCGPIAGKE